MELTEFLLARIGEEQSLAERVAQRTEHMPPTSIGGVGNLGIVGYPFARVLAECEAKRRIVEDFEWAHRDYRTAPTPVGEGKRFAALMACARLAECWADHPDYREEWRP